MIGLGLILGNLKMFLIAGAVVAVVGWLAVSQRNAYVSGVNATEARHLIDVAQANEAQYRLADKINRVAAERVAGIGVAHESSLAELDDAASEIIVLRERLAAMERPTEEHQCYPDSPIYWPSAPS